MDLLKHYKHKRVIIAVDKGFLYFGRITDEDNDSITIVSDKGITFTIAKKEIKNVGEEERKI